MFYRTFTLIQTPCYVGEHSVLTHDLENMGQWNWPRIW